MNPAGPVAEEGQRRPGLPPTPLPPAAGLSSLKGNYSMPLSLRLLTLRSHKHLLSAYLGLGTGDTMGSTLAQAPGRWLGWSA